MKSKTQLDNYNEYLFKYWNINNKLISIDEIQLPKNHDHWIELVVTYIMFRLEKIGDLSELTSERELMLYSNTIEDKQFSSPQEMLNALDDFYSKFSLQKGL